MEVDPHQAQIVSGAREWIANRIRDVRLARGITQRELSNRMEIHFSRICDLERNTTDYKISTLLRAAWGLGISLEDLVKGCPGWKSRAAKQKSMVIIEYQDLYDRLVAEGISPQKASRLCDTLLSGD